MGTLAPLPRHLARRTQDSLLADAVAEPDGVGDKNALCYSISGADPLGDANCHRFWISHAVRHFQCDSIDVADGVVHQVLFVDAVGDSLSEPLADLQPHRHAVAVLDGQCQPDAVTDALGCTDALRLAEPVGVCVCDVISVRVGERVGEPVDYWQHVAEPVYQWDESEPEPLSDAELCGDAVSYAARHADSESLSGANALGERHPE